MKRELKRYNSELLEMVSEQVKDLMDSQLATIKAIVSLAEYRDEDTGLHIERTRGYCKQLTIQLLADGKYLDLIDQDFIRDIYHAAPLHDIGKVAIPDNILLKQGKLSEEEFEVIKTHVNVGVSALKRVMLQYPKNSFIIMGVELTGGHHEKWNGTGYPKGLAGLDIPLSGRIMAVADVYDALRSNRPYKKGMTHTDAADIVIKGRGDHFDPMIVDAFIHSEEAFIGISEHIMSDADQPE